MNNGTYKNKVKKEPKKGFNEIKEHALPFGFVNANDTSSLINSEYKISSHVDDMTIDESDKCRGCFITVRSSKLFNFSVQEYSTEALSVASHSAVLNSYKVYANSNSTRAELVNRESPTTLGYGLPSAVTLNIDPFLMGVGGDDSWSACIHEEYTLPPSVYNFKLSMSFHYQ